MSINGYARIHRRVSTANTEERRGMWKSGKSERMMVGISPSGDAITLPGMNIGEAFIGSLEMTGKVYYLTYMVIAKIFTGNAQAKKTLGGPVLIVSSMSQAAGHGILPFLQFLAIISLALAVMNSMPIPILDGGHVMFLGLEAVRGKPLSDKTMSIITHIFFAILISLMVYITFLDILRISG